MNALPPTSVLRLQRHGFVLLAQIDDPHTRNAMTSHLIEDFEVLLPAIAQDRSIRALVIRGRDDAFCAGADLKNTGGDVRAANRRGGSLFAALHAQPQTVVAVVEGAAFGGGMGLACCADVIVAGPGARFALTETSIGLIPAQIAPYVVARIGVAAARRLALTAERIDAAEALRVGLADLAPRTAPDVAKALAAILAGIARCAPQASAATKRLLHSLAPVDDGYRDRAANEFAACLLGDEAREGIAAFADKRPPAWRT